MWIENYDRNQMPEGMDHRDFGAECRTTWITKTTVSAPFTRTVIESPDETYAGSSCFSMDGIEEEDSKPNFLKTCHVTFRRGFTDPITATVLLPDQGIIIGDDCLIQESLWHTNLFYSEFFRNDFSTRWEWRTTGGWKAGSITPIDETVNFCYHKFEYQYFHWLMDSLPRVWLLREQSPFHEVEKWCVGPANRDFQKKTLRLFGITPDKLIWPEGQIVRFENAVIPAFTFTESLGVRPSYNSGVHHKGWCTAYFTDLRERAWKEFCTTAGDISRFVYVSRRDAGHRKIRNEDEVCAVLVALGFEIVCPGELSFDEQVSIFSNARLIVGAHGAGMTNVIWAKSADVIELVPSNLDDAGYRFICNIVGHRHHTLMARHFDHPFGWAYGDIEINVKALFRVIHEVLTSR